MVKRGKYIFIAVVLIVLILFGVLYFSMPDVPIRDVQRFEVTTVYRVVDTKLVEITDQIDTDTLRTCLPMLRAKKTSSVYFPVEMADELYEINGLYGGKPRHIILGTDEISSIYEDASKSAQRIENPDVWIKLMKLLTEHGNK